MEQESKELGSVSMYNMFAKLFASLAKEVVERFGEDGEQAIRAGVRAFGEERGEYIAKRAMQNDGKIDASTYLPNYDMERSNDFTSADKYGENQVEQLFTKCVFAEQWTADDMQKYGLLYCEEIDPAIARGFCKDFECIHDKHFFSDGVCSFCFKMKK